MRRSMGGRIMSTLVAFCVAPALGSWPVASLVALAFVLGTAGAAFDSWLERKRQRELAGD